jgi:dienelactone hydrolase
LKNGKTDAGYTAHPTAIQTGELAAIEKPLSIAAAGRITISKSRQARVKLTFAEIDTVWPAEHRHEAEGILSKTGQPYQINVYGGVQHGFAARGDMSNAHLKTSKELAFLQALNWFQYYL